MARLEERNDAYFTTIRGMCRRCRSIVPARVSFRDGQVWQQALCPTCVNEPALIASNKDWYLANQLRTLPDRSPLPGARPAAQGCPHDCGPCAWHASPCQLPVLSITNACNLRCPICFTYNRSDRLYHMPVEEMRRTVDWIVESTGGVDLINITGGEPTLHAQLLDILRECRRSEIGRITMNSNGIRLAEDPALCRQLAELGVYVILSLNTFDRKVSEQLHGCDLVETKLRAIENLSKAGAQMTLLNVLIRGVNEDALSGLIDLLRTHDHILSLTIQTMTYTGQGGRRYARTRHVPVDDAARIVCRESHGSLTFEDFVTRPSAHPLCYLIAYLLKEDSTLLPMTRIASRSAIELLIRDSYLIRPGRDDTFFRDVINELYAAGQTEHLAILRGLVERLYPPGKALTDFDRQRIAESAVRTIYVHAHMDEDTFDCSRAMLCPDLVPAEPGRFIPACTYNLFYRMRDERFFVQDHAEASPGCPAATGGT